MSETASSLQQKQQYLRQNIINAGYDAEKFVQFCAKTHDLDDLENWSMKELVNIVQNFINQFGNRSQQKRVGQKQFVDHHNKSTPVYSVVPQNKLAVTISDDDWNSFLQAPSILDSTKKVEKPVIELPKDLIFDFNFGNEIEKIKDYPLSPPSNLKNNKNQPNKQVEQHIKTTQKRSSGQQKVQPVVFQKMERRVTKDSGPINLSNIRLYTAKEKLQPLLPLINDVVVTKTEQISRNFLQGDYTLYHIHFPPTQHIIKRKFSDFRKVRSLLQKFYPFLRLPYLEPQGWISSSEGRDPQTLNKYKWMVEEFIEYILLKSKELKDCELVRILCGLSLNGQKQDLKKKMESLQAVSRPKYIGEIILSENSFVIPPIGTSEREVSNALGMIGQIDIQYDKLRKQLDNLFATYEVLTKNYVEIAGTFEVLQNLTRKYKNENGEQKDGRVFEGLKQIVIKLAKQINGESDVFKDRIRNLFRYQKQNMATLKEVFESRNKIHHQYQRQGNPPFTSNSMRIQGSNVEIQSPVLLDEPVRNSKNILALQQTYWSFCTSREIDRYWQHLRRKICQHLTYIAYDELDRENENLNFWNTMIKKCVI